MAFSHKLHNPSPFDVDIEWDRGVIIQIKADSSTDLTTAQMEDFLPGRPGSEEAQKVLHVNGLFLEDSDRDYDVQAIEALRKAVKEKSDRYSESVQRLSDLHTMQGIDAKPDSPAFQAKLKSMGLSRLRTEISLLDKRIDIYKRVVTEEDITASSGPKYDPEKTIFVLDPPREFKSKTAMDIFLGENPEIATQHEQQQELIRKAEEAESEEE